MYCQHRGGFYQKSPSCKRCALTLLHLYSSTRLTMPAFTEFNPIERAVASGEGPSKKKEADRPCQRCPLPPFSKLTYRIKRRWALPMKRRNLSSVSATAMEQYDSASVICPNLYLGSTAPFGHQVLIFSILGSGKEWYHAPIATLRDMLWNAWSPPCHADHTSNLS